MQMMQGVENEEMPSPRRKRRGRKSANFRVPKTMPISVRALWEQATEEEQKLAHQTCATILEYWLGRASKAEAMKRLELPALRVWQLSQQALSGMLAGLLKQPRTRGGGRRTARASSKRCVFPQKLQGIQVGWSKPNPWF